MFKKEFFAGRFIGIQSTKPVQERGVKITPHGEMKMIVPRCPVSFELHVLPHSSTTVVSPHSCRRKTGFWEAQPGPDPGFTSSLMSLQRRMLNHGEVVMRVINNVQL